MVNLCKLWFIFLNKLIFKKLEKFYWPKNTKLCQNHVNHGKIMLKN